MTIVEPGSPGSRRATGRFFAEAVHDYALQHAGQSVSVLQAGCLAPLRELGLGGLSERGYLVSVAVVDSDQPLPRRVFEDTASAYDDVFTGDLRTVPIPPRAYDVVYCALLLERVRHVELVLDRLTGALKPGGLLLVRTGDRYTAASVLDRLLPGPVRRAVWSRFRPGVPGPFSPVYEKTVSQDGIAAYMHTHGLVIAARATELTPPQRPARLSALVRLGCAVIAGLTGGRYSDGHDELLFVIRKPLDQFARVLLADPPGGDAGVDGTRLAVLADHRARGDDRTLADLHPGQDRDAGAEPAAGADVDLLVVGHPGHLAVLGDVVGRGDDHGLRADERVAADVDAALALEAAAAVDVAAVADAHLAGLERALLEPGDLTADAQAGQPQQAAAQRDRQQGRGGRGHAAHPAQHLGGVIRRRQDRVRTAVPQFRFGQRTYAGGRCHNLLQARSNN